MKFSIRATVFTVLVILFQILFFVLFITLTDYGEFGMPTWVTNVSFTLNSSIFSTDSITTQPTDLPTTPAITTPAPTPAPLKSNIKVDSNQKALRDNPNEYLKAALHRKLKMNKLVIKDDQEYPRNYEISHLRPRFFLPPGSEVPPLPENPIEGPYYSMLPINVMIFAGLGLLFSSIRCSSFTGLGFTFFLACFAFQWAALIVPWLMQAAVGIHDAQKIYYNITTLIDILYAVFSMIVAFGALVGRASRIQLLVVTIFGVVLYAANRMVVCYYLVTLDLAGSMTVFVFGSFYGLSVSWVINAYYGKSKCKKTDCCLYSGYFENLFSLLGTIIIFVHFPYFCAYLIPVTLDMYLRTIVNTYFSMVSCVVVVYALSSAMGRNQKIDIGQIQRATLAGGVAVASVAPLLLKIWGAVLLGSLSGMFSVLSYRWIQKYWTRIFLYDSGAVFSTFAVPGIIGGIASAVMASLAVSPRDYTLNELFILYPAITGPNGVGSPRSDTTQGGYQFASLLVSIGMAVVGGMLVGIIVRYMGPIEEDESHNDNTFFTLPYGCGDPCPCSPANDKKCCPTKEKC